MTDIFSEQNQEQNVAPKFEDLVGEGKKFKDTEAVANKVWHADQHINKLEAELEELRTELRTRTTVEDTLTRLQQRQIEERPPIDNTNNREENRSENSNVNVAEVVASELNKLREKDRREANLVETRAGLKERFGADYNSTLLQVAEQLGVSKDFLTSMATTTPQGFFKLIDSVKAPDDRRPVNVPSPLGGGGRQVSDAGVRDNEYYQNMRRTDPVKYFDKRTQKMLHDDAMRLGNRFYTKN